MCLREFCQLRVCFSNTNAKIYEEKGWKKKKVENGEIHKT